ncbi:methyltransferase domain-containing protein [Candidatus Peregrinibacteria bacterium]|nr:methyltransferase domain-containing protein [Candidatus Peregrinibacteria bacterium]
MKTVSKAWEKIFQQQGKVFMEPHWDMPKVIKQLKDIKAEKVLDLGSGTGRHVINLAQNGFSVYGLDNSQEGINTTKQWLKTEKLNADLVLQEMTEKLPWEDNYFDAIVCVQVIHHADIAAIKKIIAEMERVLKKGGFIFVTVPKLKNQATKYKEIEPNTYVPLDGWEKGLPHHYFNPEELKDFFLNFDIVDIHLDQISHHCMSAFKL